ncbi:MAG: DUF6268 family outer membrane beta-barrel protein [Chthoniobacterales bacterium]
MKASQFRSFLRSGAVAVCLTALSIFAQDSSFPGFSGEYLLEETYVGESDVRRGTHTVHNFDESDSVLRFILTPRVSLGVLRLGADWERFSFGFPALTRLPNTLQSADLVVGLDTQFSNSILIRFEAQPGVYGTNHFSIDTFNVPFVIGGTYIYNANAQFVAGVSVDAERKYPVLPGGGLRWKLHRQWVLDAVLPKPRLEYDPSKDIELYIGANIKETSFRVDDRFGDTHVMPGVNNRISRLDNAVLTYSEVRTGVGCDWKLSSNATLTAEAGYQPYRNFDFYRADVRFRQHGSAPYGMISLHGAF